MKFSRQTKICHRQCQLQSCQGTFWNSVPQQTTIHNYQHLYLCKQKKFTQMLLQKCEMAQSGTPPNANSPHCCPLAEHHWDQKQCCHIRFYFPQSVLRISFQLWEQSLSPFVAAYALHNWHCWHVSGCFVCTLRRGFHPETRGKLGQHHWKKRQLSAFYK